MRINISIPDNNIPERKYTILTFLSLFTDIDKVDIKFHIKDIDTYTLFQINEYKIIINNAFWVTTNDNLGYLSLEYLPIPYLSSSLKTPTSDKLIILYGNDTVQISQNEIYCGIDIFAGTFFMLSRWEEELFHISDRHGRFPMNASIAYKHSFSHRPIINEYIELFKSFIKTLNIPNYPYKERTFNLIPTHDVDTLFHRVTPKAFLGDLLKRKNLESFLERVFTFFRDPVLTFNYLMSESEKAGLKSHFYFMATQGKQYDPKDYTNTQRFKNIITDIKERGHIIGFHPGYSTLESPEEWTYQYIKLRQHVPTPITEGRQHYLRWHNTDSERIWNTNNMAIDSTIGYAEAPGFRCGTGDSYPLFDINNRKQLNLKEQPLIIMDASFSKYGKQAAAKCSEALYYYTSIAITYNMSLTILFHNSNFTKEWNGMKKVYSDYMNYIASLKKDLS